MRAHATTEALIEAASAPYWKTDFFGYFKARGKLRGDPAFAGILREGLLAGAERILDLGCGQGLLAAWLERPNAETTNARTSGRRNGRRHRARFHSEALNCRRGMYGARGWPWANGRNSRSATSPNADFGSVDAIIILDVLHYLDQQAQLRVLDHARAALSPEGILLLRVGDAGSGIRFIVGQCIDWTVMVTHYRRTPRMYCRPVPEWQRLLTSWDSGVRPCP